MLSSYPARDTYFDREAEDYDRRIASNPVRKMIGRREFEALGKLVTEFVASHSRILDAPTGTGRFVPLLRKLGHRITCLDISSDMLRECRRQSGEADFAAADCEALPFEDGAYDYVISMRFLGHLPPETRVRVLREFRRVGRSGIIAGYPILNPLTGLKFQIGNLRHRLTNGRPRPWWPATGHSLQKELALAGLNVVREEKLLGPLHQISLLCLDLSHT